MWAQKRRERLRGNGVETGQWMKLSGGNAFIRFLKARGPHGPAPTAPGVAALCVALRLFRHLRNLVMGCVPPLPRRCPVADLSLRDLRGPTMSDPEPTCHFRRRTAGQYS